MQNQIYYGDNLEVLRRYIKDETIDLCYIDPPFNSKRNYNQIYNNVGTEDRAQAQAFIDTWIWDDMANKGLAEIYSNYNGAFTTQSIDLIAGLEKVLKKGSLLAYLVSMTLRIVEIHRVLKPTGSFYLHCDPTASHYLKLVIDGVFCGRGGDFRNEIVWEKTRVPKAQSQCFAKQQDTIFFYTKTANYVFNYQFEQPSEPYVKKYFSQIEEITGRKYQLVSFLQNGQGQAKRFGERLIKPPNGKHWIWSQNKIDEAMEKGLLVFTNPNKPRLKKYLDEQLGKNLGTIWLIPPINSQAKERLGYETQKPESLLERIIKASSNEGDTVLDAYCGCGTTIAVAQRLNRNWIGIDITYQSISIILKRLEDNFTVDIMNSVVLNGIPKDFESAVALANKQDDRTRKEFEKWLILTYSRNQAIVNDKKGGDKGIDGIAFVVHNRDNENRKILFSVKSNKTLTPAIIRELNGTIERENAACGILLILYPMPNLVKESKQYGNYHNELVNRDFPKIQVISVEDIFGGKLIDLPNIMEVLKQSELKSNEQPKLL